MAGREPVLDAAGVSAPYNAAEAEDANTHARARTHMARALLLTDKLCAV
jgi:hypothetical protein